MRNAGEKRGRRLSHCIDRDALRHCIARTLGVGDERLRALDRILDTAVRTDDLEDLLAFRRVERLAEDRAEFGSSGAAGCERVEHGQRVHALFHVVSRGLAELLVGGGEIEHVVDDLEDHAVGGAVGGERLDDRAVVAGHQTADPCSGRIERSGLAVDRGEVRIDRSRDVVGVAQFLDLALAQSTDGAREEARDLGAERRSDLGCLGQQEVAREDRLQVAPLCVDCLHTAARGGLIHHVVVVQRSQMHELARDSAEDRLVRRCGIVAHHGGHDGEDRPQTLAAGGDQVRCDLGEIRVGGGDRVEKRPFDPLAVVVHRRQTEQR